jgi:hypothetical protein
MIPPTIAVTSPAPGGNPLAALIPKQRGKAIRETNRPDDRS